MELPMRDWGGGPWPLGFPISSPHLTFLEKKKTTNGQLNSSVSFY